MINGISDPSQIEESVDFEVFKIFAMEPQAYRLEFAMGETSIDTAHAGIPVCYHFATADELVTMAMADYVAKLEGRYVEMFPGHEAAIRAAILRSVNRHGREVFGRKAGGKARKRNADRSMKILQLCLQNRSGWSPIASAELMLCFLGL